MATAIWTANMSLRPGSPLQIIFLQAGSSRLSILNKGVGIVLAFGVNVSCLTVVRKPSKATACLTYAANYGAGARELEWSG